MILANIKQYLQQHKSVTLQNLSLHFHSEPEAMRGMLEHWIRKGRVKKQAIKICCQGCSGCDSAEMEIYEWIA